MADTYVWVKPGGVEIGWIGTDPNGSGDTGAWLKKAWIGGTHQSNAPFVADASGHVAISGTAANPVSLQINLNGSTTLIANGTGFGGNAAGVQVSVNASSMKAQLQGDGVYLFNSSGANVAAFNTNISQKGHLWVSDYVQADAGYWVGFSQGITGTRTVKDGSGNNKTVTIVGGIITGWEL